MKALLGALAAALVLAPLTARAESEFSVTLNGGGVNYDRGFAGGTDIGAAYGARLGILPTPQLGVELGYLGTQNNVRQSLREGRDTQTLRSNGGYGDLRVNILPGPVMPYVFGGYGLTRFDVSNQAEFGLQGKTVSTIPFGAGLDFTAGAFKIGGRFQYNYLLTDQLFRPSATATGVTTGNNADFYGVTVDLGASFH